MRKFALSAIGEFVPANQMYGVEDIAKVVALAGIHHINNFTGVKLSHAIMNGRKIRGGIKKSAVSLANDQRSFLFGNANDEGALIFLGKTVVNERLNCWREFVAVKTFTARMFVGQSHAKYARDFKNICHGDIDQFLPRGNGGDVAGLKFQQCGLRVLLGGDGAFLLCFKLYQPMGTGATGARGFKTSGIGGGFKLGGAIRVVEIRKRE